MITEIKGILRYTISNGMMPIYITPLLPNKRNRRESSRLLLAFQKQNLYRIYV